jgi:hypothetical protein
MATYSRPTVGLTLALLILLPAAAQAAEPTTLAAVTKPAVPSAAASTPASDGAGGATVPLARVVLFSSGVGFFDRQGQVDGNAAVAIKFNAGDINDLLKSLVVEDRAGQIAAVTYGSKDPITKTLQKFAINLTSNPTLAQILNQIRGERIEFSAPGPMSGTLLGVETRTRQPDPKQPPVAVEILNVLSDDGLRSVPLDQVGTIKIANAQLDKEFRQALAVLALGHDADKKSVTLHFNGQGPRPVRVGYIQNMPIWKTSYRLVLTDDGQPKLQGWAIVENTTEEDWHDVGLTLVSGRPVSFIMNLYDPLYVQRPTVEPELFAGLRPQVYGQALGDTLVRDERAKQGFGNRGAGKHFAKLSQKDLNAAAADESAADSMTESEAVDSPVAGGSSSGKQLSFTVSKPLYQAFAPSANEAAASGDVGELFQYSIVPPVTLNRQESAMLPIVDGQVSGKKVSVYNPAVQAKHPLCGMRLKNTTELHLMQGPITVFDGGAYAGDARIEDIAPGVERLLTYALDLDVEVADRSTNASEEITHIRMIKGMLIAEHKAVRTRKYTLKNSSQKDKTILVEQPLDNNWHLITPQEPTEKTATLYRFAVDVPADKSADLEVVEERIYNQSVAINNAATDLIHFFQSQRVISPAVKQSLEKIVEMKTRILQLTENRKQLELQLKNINEEQNRIRQNMQQLDRVSDLYKRYVKKFGDQEDSVEQLRGQIEKSIQDETKEAKALDAFLLSLDLK